MNRAGRAAATTTAFVAGLLALLPGTAVATATGPVHGWWSQTTLASGAELVPPDVPADGLYVQNAPSGPVAVSAIAYPAGSGPVVSLSLHAAGQPLMSQPPAACLVRTPIKPEQAGAWADRPDLDCTQPVVGVPSADGSAVRFDLTALAGEGVTGVGIVAGGPTDRVAFAAPTADAFVFGTSPATASAPPIGPAPQDESAAPATAFAGSPPLAGGNAPGAQPGPLAASIPPPSVASQQPAAANPATVAVTRTAAEPSGRRRTLGTALGLGLLIACVVYWGDTFGAAQLRRGRLLREMRELREQSVGASA